MFTRRLICLSAFICYAINFITNIRTHTMKQSESVREGREREMDNLIGLADTNHIKVYVNAAAG